MRTSWILLVGIVIGFGGMVFTTRYAIPVWHEKTKSSQTPAPTELPENDTPPPEIATVTEVVDAITMRLNSGHLVRYIGVRSPDTKKEVQCFGKEAILANESVIGQEVRLEEEPLLLRSRDGAWTRYVWLIQGEIDPSPSPTPSPDQEEHELDSEDAPAEEPTTEEENQQPNENEDHDEKDIFINERILEGGFGFPVLAENMTYGERMLSAARFASATGKGLWGQCEIDDSNEDELQTKATEECTIKGVEFGEGKKVYRTNQCTSYESTLVIQSSGGQWFCSEEEAQEAGFEKAPDC